MGSRKNEMMKARADRKFLERIRSADVSGLHVMLRNHTEAPEWKLVAIKRALARAEKVHAEGNREEVPGS